MLEVLIVGAGPTGLALALWLARQGIVVRIVDRSAGPGETSRAMAVQARTLELYRQLDLDDAVIADGYRNPAVNLWARGRHRARIVLRDAGVERSPYPFILIYPQDCHERLLIERLGSSGVVVERNTELLGLEDDGGRVRSRLRMPDGSEQTCESCYVAACDGARSTIRQQLGIGFEGGTYRQLFYVADVELQGLERADEAHVALGDGDFVAVLPYGTAGECRLIGTVRDERADRAEDLGFADVSGDAIAALGVRIVKINWFSTYRVHHRVADAFRRGRVFLLGDAAHIHSPAGGQGMNTGILDAINLAWKLADVLKGRASDPLLDSYALERQAFARTLVATTDRAFTFVTATGAFANAVRTHVAPGIASLAYRVGKVRERLFRIVSQTMLHYRASPLSAGKAGRIEGGDRLAWVPAAGADNFGPAGEIGWQVHVYGAARAELHDWCARQGIALQVFEWLPAHERAGFARDAAYLLRPDAYVAFADPEASATNLETYLTSRGYRPDLPSRVS